MNKETMRKHYETTPKDILINILISSREEVEKLQSRNKERKQEIERLNKKIEQYENPEDMTLMYMWCDEKAKDEIKRLNNIIKEVRELINYYGITPEQNDDTTCRSILKQFLEILDKVDKEK